MKDPVAMLKDMLPPAVPHATQAALAHQIGISPQFLSEILKGKPPGKLVLDFLGLEKRVTYHARVAETSIGTDRRSRTRRRA